jgi:hypothetical protein
MEWAEGKGLPGWGGSAGSAEVKGEREVQAPLGADSPRGAQGRRRWGLSRPVVRWW